MDSKLSKLDKSMKAGKEYRISSKNGRHGGNRAGPAFHATLIKKMDMFYIFKVDKGYRECILKVDFITGEYRALEV